MKLQSYELTGNGYILLDTMDHREIIPFVRKFLKKKTLTALFYYLVNIVFAALLIFFCVKYYRSGHFGIPDGLVQVSIGIAIVFALIPLHEFIHVLAYKLQGAQHTSYDVNLKKFYFLAIADKFVANRQEFKVVALAPFTIISLGLGMSLFFTGHLWTITVLTSLLIHASCCSGDFALLSYFEFNKNKEVVTYDDKENNISFFYGKDRKNIA